MRKGNSSRGRGSPVLLPQRHGLRKRWGTHNTKQDLKGWTNTSLREKGGKQHPPPDVLPSRESNPDPSPAVSPHIFHYISPAKPKDQPDKGPHVGGRGGHAVSYPAGAGTRRMGFLLIGDSSCLSPAACRQLPPDSRRNYVEFCLAAATEFGFDCHPVPLGELLVYMRACPLFGHQGAPPQTPCPPSVESTSTQTPPHFYPFFHPPSSSPTHHCWLEILL